MCRRERLAEPAGVSNEPARAGATARVDSTATIPACAGADVRIDPPAVTVAWWWARQCWSESPGAGEASAMPDAVPDIGVTSAAGIGPVRAAAAHESADNITARRIKRRTPAL